MDHMHFGCHSTELIAGATDSFLKSCDTGEPFFAYASFLAPHDSRTMPEAFLDIYREVELPLPPNFLPEHPIDTGALRVRDESLEDFPRRPERIRQHLREYYAMISHIDHQVGVLLARLEARGLLERLERDVHVLQPDDHRLVPPEPTCRAAARRRQVRERWARGRALRLGAADAAGGGSVAGRGALSRCA